MSYLEAERTLNRLGLKPVLAIDGLELPDLRTRADLDDLRDRGLQEMETRGESRAYLQWQRALQLGLDESLPDLAVAGGAVGKTMGQINAEAATAISRSQQFLRADQLDPRLQGVVVNGVPVTEIPVDQLRDNLSILLLESPEYERGPIMDAISALDNSPHSSMGMGIDWELPDPGLVVEANTGSYNQSDAYTNWRNGGAASDHGIEGLYIRPSVSNDPIFSGITNMSGSGGTYEIASDWAAAQAAGGGESDD